MPIAIALCTFIVVVGVIKTTEIIYKYKSGKKRSEEKIVWYPISKLPKEHHGWFMAAINPANYEKLTADEINAWRNEFGFTKVWYNEDAVNKWYEPDPHGYRSRPVEDIITHWAYPIKVPKIEKNDSNSSNSSRPT